MNDDGNNGNIRSIGSAPTEQNKRDHMTRLLSHVLVQVASGECLGVIVTAYMGGRAYQIRWAGDHDPMQLVGAVEATKLQVLPGLLNPTPIEPPKEPQK